MQAKLPMMALLISLVFSAIAATSAAGEASPTPMNDAAAKEAFVKANTAYESEQYSEAIEIYRSILNDGYKSGPLYYNLGNAELRAGSLGRSIAAYREATALLPRDGDLAANLKYARDSTKDDLGDYTRPLTETIFFWHKGLGIQELAIGVLLVNALWWILLAMKLYWRESELLLWGTRGSLAILLALGTSLILRVVSPEEIAVVQPPEVSIYSGTSHQSTVLFKLHEGSELKVVETTDEWVRVALPDDKQGWLPHAEVELIRI